MGWKHGTLEERFLAKVDKSAGAKGCWPWTGMKAKRGYGRINDGTGKKLSAHRVAWILANGPIPDRLWILHKCDNPPCCNPRHLRPGTHADNMADMKAKGRGVNHRGEAHGMAKLTAAQVVEIRSLEGTMIQKDIALRFGVNQTLVGFILRRVIWAHIP